MTILPAVSPQSTGSATPVTAEAASEARKATTRATSSGSTMRPSGYQRASFASTSGFFLAALLLHAGNDSKGAVIGAVEIAVDVMLPGLGIGARESRMLGEAGIVDEDV